MRPRQFALIAGIIFLVMGVTSFIPSLSSDPANLPALNLDTSYGEFLGLFPMNIINKLALCLFGVMGILAYRAPTTSLPKSVKFSRSVAFVMIPGAILGLIPATQTFFGYWPLYGSEVAVHGLFGLLGAYFGFALTSKAHQQIEPLLEGDRSFEIKHKERSDRAA